jgi:hypothetical protein
MSAAPSVLSNPHDFVAVSDAKLANAGAIVTWNLSGSFDPEPFRKAWAAEGLSLDLCPELPTEQKALGMAMSELREHRTLIRPLDRGAGWKVVPEHASGDDLDYDTTGLTAKLDKVGRPVFTPQGHLSAPKVKALYEEFLVAVPCTQTSGWLASTIMPAVDATSIKRNGGVYFVPPHQLPAFERMVRVIHAHTQHRVYAVHVVKSESTVEMVLDSMTNEVVTECDQLLRKLNELGERAIETRVGHLNMLLSKVARFEKLLGVKLEAAREAALEADGALAAAALAAAPDMKS